MAAKMLDTRRAAEYLDFAAGTLENWRGAGKGPRFVRIEGKVRYLVADLDAWIAEQITDPEGGER